MNLKNKIRNIPDWPQKGVNFKDITPVLEDSKYFKFIINEMFAHYKKSDIDKIAGVDARGFLLAAPLAYKLDCGLTMIRKKSKLPPQTVKTDYSLEYGKNTLEVGVSSIKNNENILIVDDVLATGGTAKATVDLIEKVGGNIVSLAFLIELKFLRGKDKLNNYDIFSLLHYNK